MLVSQGLGTPIQLVLMATSSSQLVAVAAGELYVPVHCTVPNDNPFVAAVELNVASIFNTPSIHIRTRGLPSTEMSFMISYQCHPPANDAGVISAPTLWYTPLENVSHAHTNRPHCISNVPFIVPRFGAWNRIILKIPFTSNRVSYLKRHRAYTVRVEAKFAQIVDPSWLPPVQSFRTE